MERISLFFVHMNIELHFDRWKVYELSCRTMDHRITESLRWEMSSKIPKFKPNPSPPCPLITFLSATSPWFLTPPPLPWAEMVLEESTKLMGT